MRVDLRPADEDVWEPPDAWVVLQTFRARHADAAADVGLDHLMTACAPVHGVPFVGGYGIGGAPFVGGYGVGGAPFVGGYGTGGAPFVGGYGTAGSASQQYAVPGLGGRTPVTWMGGPPARTPELTGRRPVVAVLDTAIGEHPWFPADVVERDPEVDGQVIGLGGDDGTGTSEDPFEGILDADTGHGTFIAGLVHQLCPDARILGIRIMPTSGAVREGDLLAALWQLVRRQGLAQSAGDAERIVDVVNLSLGYYHETPEDFAYDSALLGALLALARLGVAVVAAAGNGSTDRLMFPAAFAPFDQSVVQLREGPRPAGQRRRAEPGQERGAVLEHRTVGELLPPRRQPGEHDVAEDERQRAVGLRGDAAGLPAAGDDRPRQFRQRVRAVEWDVVRGAGPRRPARREDGGPACGPSAGGRQPDRVRRARMGRSDGGARQAPAAGVRHTDPASGTLATRAAALFAAFRDGDERSMADLVSLLTPILWHTARAQRLDRDAAEDVVQTAWLSLVRSAGSISDPQAVLQWLIISVKREAWRVVRGSDREDVTEIEADDVVATSQAEPETSLLRRDGDRRLWHHITKLPERCQQLLRVIAFADRPDYAAIATALGMPVGSIGPTRGRCLAKLRAALTSDPGWESP